LIVTPELLPSRSRANYRAALGYVLLLIISYGATVQTVHSHGPVSPSHPDVAAVSDAGGSQPSQTGHSNHRECSMCQFQQQLVNGLVHTPLFALTPSSHVASVSTPIAAYPSTSITRPSGRAPPLGWGWLGGRGSSVCPLQISPKSDGQPGAGLPCLSCLPTIALTARVSRRAT